ncbi:MAG: TolC family protein [Gemmataceae bacterium]|nr:TolC family protein [Gemmataceae bacterium]
MNRLGLLLMIGVVGCTTTAGEVCRNAILPEARVVATRDPGQLPTARIPDSVAPRTVSDPRPQETEWRLSLDEAIKVALDNARVIRVLAGVTAVSSGRTVYDPAIALTAIDQEQGRFDPNFQQKNRYTRLENAAAFLDLIEPNRALLTNTVSDEFRSDVGLNKTNVLGGEWGLNWVETPTRFGGLGITPLNPQNRSAVELSYNQPLLQGGGFVVNTAPIVIARLNTERSFFQYKGSVQDLVSGVIEAYWNLVFARTELWARQIQVQQAEGAYKREEARKASGLGDLKDVAQAKSTYTQFKALLVAAEAAVLTREGALRNILGIPPDDGRVLVPVSAPTNKRLRPEWNQIVQLAEQRRPDIVELKLVVEADQVRRAQLANGALPRLDLTGLYRWNGFSGEMPNGERLATGAGQYTDWSVGVNFSVPLGLRQARARVREIELLTARDRAFVDQSVHAAIHELAATMRDLDSSYEQYLAYRQSRAAGLENLLVQLEQFRADRAIYLSVLQALNDWGNSVTNESRALVSYNIQLATLERQTGTILETHGLVFAEERFRMAGPLGWSHCRDYPKALPPGGEPQKYPSTGEPGENSFDLKNPAKP